MGSGRPTLVLFAMLVRRGEGRPTFAQRLTRNRDPRPVLEAACRLRTPGEARPLRTIPTGANVQEPRSAPVENWRSRAVSSMEYACAAGLSTESEDLRPNATETNSAPYTRSDHGSSEYVRVARAVVQVDAVTRPQPEKAFIVQGWGQDEAFDSHCCHRLVRTSIRMQRGEPPYRAALDDNCSGRPLHGKVADLTCVRAFQFPNPRV